jgi:hypothetical protein
MVCAGDLELFRVWWLFVASIFVCLFVCTIFFVSLVCSIIPKRLLVFLTSWTHPSIWVQLRLFLVLTCWTHASIWVRLRLFLVMVVLVLMCYLFLYLFQICWDLQVSEGQVYLHCLFERAFKLVACSGGCWHAGDYGLES